MSSFDNQKAFTIVEGLVVAAIIAVLAAVTYPVITHAKAEALITKDITKLRNCQLAVSLYRSDNEQLSILPLGLPSMGDVAAAWKRASFYGTNENDWNSACGWHPSSDSPGFVLFGSKDEEARRYYDQHGDASILLVDLNCNEARVNLRAPFVNKRALGVLVNGTAVRRVHAGTPDSYGFWDGR
jgi:prepilin-type N-terminal cleavage/methylation domain-containing protein